jgi:hypothetical protein
MRNHQLGIAFALGIVLTCSPAASAQSKRPAKAAKAPSSAQARDLSGVWMLDRPRLQTVVERYWIYEFIPEEPPMTAWGAARYKATKSSFGTHSFPLAETNDPIFRNCSPTGFPRIFTHPFPMQVVQTPGEVIMLFEWDSTRHEIFTDGRPHNTALGPLWMGDSIGHWEGDTLVADTVNFNDKTWLDRVGHPHSDALHVVERIRRVNHNHLLDDITIEDPKAYTKPWKAELNFLLRPTWTLGEQFCEDQETFLDIEKKETTPAK